MKQSLSGIVEQLTRAMGKQEQIPNIHRAQVLNRFAEQVAEAVLLRAGFKKPITETVDEEEILKWNYNLIADPFLIAELDEPTEGRPGDTLRGVKSLYLHSVPTSLDQCGEFAPTAHELTFCHDRVVDWDCKRGRIRSVMTYEEAARFVILWLAEKILQIIRKNEWDRVKDLLDLYDRLATFWAPDDMPLKPYILTRAYGGQDGFNHGDYAGTVHAYNLEEAVEKTGLTIVDRESDKIQLVSMLGRTYSLFESAEVTPDRAL